MKADSRTTTLVPVLAEHADGLFGESVTHIYGRGDRDEAGDRRRPSIAISVKASSRGRWLPSVIATAIEPGPTVIGMVRG